MVEVISFDINSKVKEHIREDMDYEYVLFENGYKLEFCRKDDCCAHIWCDIDDLFKEEQFISAVKIIMLVERKEAFIAAYDDSYEEIDRNAFYNSNNGYYSPSIEITLYDENEKEIESIELDDDNVER